MLVYLFLWFYLSTSHISNGLQILTESEEKSSSRKYRNPDRSFKQHIVAHSPKSLPDALTEQEMPLMNINDLLSQLRDNWEAPSTYLEKRGYLTNKRSDKKHKEHHIEHSSREHDNGAKSFKDQLRKYHERKNAHLKGLIDTDESSRGETSRAEPNKRLTNPNKFFYFPHSSNKIKKESQNEAKVPCTTPSPTTEMVVGTCPPKPEQLGIMTRLRNSFRSLFKPSKASSWKDDLNMYSDIMNEEPADNLKKAKQKVSNFRFDDSWLNRDSSEDFLVEKRSYDYVIPSLEEDNVAEAEPSYCGGNPAQAPPTNCATSAPSSQDLSIKFADVLKNLTQADIDYVRNFLKCYKENKEKFYVDYLHMNKTLINETSNGGGPLSHGAHNTLSLAEKNNTEEMIKCQPDAKKPKISVTTSKPGLPLKKVDSGSKESHSTTPAAGKEDDTVKVDIDLRTNETGSGGLGMEDESHNETKCTPIRLNEVSLDVEWSSQDDNDSQNQPFGGCLTFSTNGEKPYTENNDLFSTSSKDSQKNQLSLPDSNNFAIPNSLSKYNIPKVRYNSDYFMFDPSKKKREIALPENNEEEAVEEDTPVSEDYSELLPSLSVFGSSKKRPLPLDEYIEDYNLGLSRSVKSTGGDDNEDYDYNDSSTDDNEFLGRKKKKKRKHKKKYNKKSNNQNHQTFDTSRDDLSEIVPEDEDISPPENDDLEKSSNDFLNFPELSDIKFHVSSDQEEDIEKFISSINAPPEVFSFDVEKYLKPKSVSEPVAFDSPPVKTFYEFVGAPPIEKEQVPFIVPDSSESSALPDAAVETLAKESRNNHPKRDILRQYIKGISEQLANKPPYHQATGAVAVKSEQSINTPSDAVPVDRSEALMTNYANDLDVLNFERYEQPVPKEVATDDFIDKFYLLNDGSYSLYGSQKTEAKQVEKTKVDPINVGIDLDLDKKFKDLTLYPAVSKAPVEKELDLTKNPVNNLDMVYIPDSVYHKPSPIGKMNDMKSYPLNFDNNHS